MTTQSVTIASDHTMIAREPATTDAIERPLVVRQRRERRRTALRSHVRRSGHAGAGAVSGGGPGAGVGSRSNATRSPRASRHGRTISRPSISATARSSGRAIRRRPVLHEQLHHPRPGDRPPGRFLDDALFEHRRLPSRRTYFMPPTNRSPGQTLALVEHVHLAGRDHVARSPGSPPATTHRCGRARTRPACR